MDATHGAPAAAGRPTTAEERALAADLKGMLKARGVWIDEDLTHVRALELMRRFPVGADARAITAHLNAEHRR